jgi:CAAX protease family protein
MLPEKTLKFQEYYAPALKTKALWRLLVGLIVLGVVYMGFSFVLGLGLMLASGIENSQRVLTALSEGADPQSMALLLSSFVAMLFGVILAVKLVHKRSFKSLLGPDLGQFSRNFKIAFATALTIVLVSTPIFALLDTPVKNMEFSRWLSWMVIGIPLILLQVSAEELVFRGYIQQQLAARFNSRWIWYVLPSVLFGLLHYDPERMGSNTWLVIASATLFGLIAADVTARTGNLGAAIGLHFANNIYAIAIIGTDGALSGLSLYKTTFNVSDELAMRSAIIPSLIFMTLLYALFLLWCRNRPQL